MRENQKNKGQVNIYFLISIALFIALSIYLIYIVLGYYPTKSESIQLNSLNTKSYIISELLLKDPGYPEDWNENNVERLGLASDPMILDPEKIEELADLCNENSPESRERILNATGLTDEKLTITIYELDGTTILECQPFGDTSGIAEYNQQRVSRMARVATLEGKLVEVTVYVE